MATSWSTSNEGQSPYSTLSTGSDRSVVIAAEQLDRPNGPTRGYRGAGSSHTISKFSLSSSRFPDGLYALLISWTICIHGC
jgi:hypothetical protein